MSAYTINSTISTTYIDKLKGVVNGVLISFTMTDYDEVGQVRIPEMSAKAAKDAIEKFVSERDAMAE